ncbi:hypothetical protein ABIE12_001267 [Serratia sp. 509]
MKKTTPTLHDAVFKQFLTHPDTARDFLEFHLPPALLKDAYNAGARVMLITPSGGYSPTGVPS